MTRQGGNRDRSIGPNEHRSRRLPNPGFVAAAQAFSFAGILLEQARHLGVDCFGRRAAWRGTAGPEWLSASVTLPPGRAGVTGRIRELLPQRLTVRRASSVACCMSPSAQVSCPLDEEFHRGRWEVTAWAGSRPDWRDRHRAAAAGLERVLNVVLADRRLVDEVAQVGCSELLPVNT